MSEFSTESKAAAQPEKKKKKRGGLALIIGGAFLAAAVGGVFATNVISINSTNVIELGNGVADTAACDTTGVSTAVNQIWNPNAGSYGAFIVSDVVVSNVDDSGCNGKKLKVLLIDSLGTPVCSVTGVHASPDFPNADTHIAQDQFDVATGTTSYTVDLAGNSGAQKLDCLAADVAKVALETTN